MMAMAIGEALAVVMNFTIYTPLVVFGIGLAVWVVATS